MTFIVTYVKELLSKLGRLFSLLAIGAFFINIFLLVFANTVLTGVDSFELSILAIANMMLLSFALLREPNVKS